MNSSIYIQEIKYDDPDKQLIQLDKKARYEDVKKVVKGLESMKIPLANLVTANAEKTPEEVVGYLNYAQRGLTDFFGQGPERQCGKSR